MPTCPHCGAEHTAEELVRHQLGELLMVHCPDCNFMLGMYNQHSESPKTDRKRQS